jgi:hypothetical protein
MNCIEPEISEETIMSTQFDPLKTTAQELHRFWFYVRTTEQWYSIIRECRTWFGPNWKSMSKIRRKLQDRHSPAPRHSPIPVWFEVPDPRFATWISVKFSLQVQSDTKFQAAK